MSRSRKKPAGGFCCCRTSEKDDKRIWHRRYRHACKQALQVEGADLEILPHFRELSNPWSMAKDGKGYYGFPHPGDSDWWVQILERMMRK